MTLGEIKACVADLLPDEHPNSDISRVGILLFAALVVGPNIQRMREFTGLPIGVVQNTSYYLRYNKVWLGKGPYLMHYEWLDNALEPPTDTSDDLLMLGFLMDCMVGAGRLMRQTNEDGVVGYQMRRFGEYTTADMDDEWSQLAWAAVAQPEVRERKRLERCERRAKAPAQ